MTDWPHSKQIASEIVRGWMLLDATERTTDKLVEEIELELGRSFEAGMRAANHAAPLIEAAALERAAQLIEANDEDYMMRGEVAAAIRALIPAKDQS